MDGKIPAPPPGFQIVDDGQAAPPAPPPGFVLEPSGNDAAAATPPHDAEISVLNDAFWKATVAGNDAEKKIAFDRIKQLGGTIKGPSPAVQPIIEAAAAKSAAADMGTWGRFAAGMGHGAVDVGQAIKQLALHGAGAVGLADPSTVRNYDQEVADDAARYEEGLGGTTAGKFGNFVGGALTTAPVGGLTGSAAKVLIGDAGKTLLGAAAKGAIQGGAAAAVSQPVTDPDSGFAGQKLGQTTLGAATGGVADAGLYGAGRVVREALSRNAPFRQAAGNLETPQAQNFLRESEQLSRDTGVPFTPGQATGSKGLMGLENAARQSSKTADRVFEVDQRAATALDDYINRVLTKVSGNARTPEEAGTMVRNALQNKVDALTAQRKAIADQQYGRIRQLVGGRPLIQPDNLRAALSDVHSQYGAIATPGARALSRFANKTADSELGNVQNLMNLRSYLSKVAGGQARISGEPVDRKVAAELLGSIDNDLDANADRLGGNVGDMLRAANQNYRNFSQQIEHVKLSPLGKLLGKDVTDTMTGDGFNTVAPERLVERLRKMQPSEVATTRKLMQDASPEAWQAVKRQLIEDALEKAHSAAPSLGANTLALQPGAFVRALGGHTPQGQAWARALFDPPEFTQLSNAFRAAQRLGDKTGFNFSGTAQQIENLGLNIPTSTLGVAQKAASGTARTLARKRLVAAMESPDGRKMLLQLSRLPPGAPEARTLAARMAAIGVAQDANDQNTRGYQDRLGRARAMWDDAMRQAKARVGQDQDVPEDQIQAALQAAAKQFNVSPDSILH